MILLFLMNIRKTAARCLFLKYRRWSYVWHRFSIDYFPSCNLLPEEEPQNYLLGPFCFPSQFNAISAFRVQILFFFFFGVHVSVLHKMSVCLSFCLTGFQIWVYLENCNCIEYYQVCCQDWWWSMCRHRPGRIKSCYVLPTNVSADCFLIPGFVVVLTHACNVSWFGMEKGKRWQMWHISNWFLFFAYDLDVKYSHQRTTPHLQPHYIPHFQH